MSAPRRYPIAIGSGTTRQLSQIEPSVELTHSTNGAAAGRASSRCQTRRQVVPKRLPRYIQLPYLLPQASGGRYFKANLLKLLVPTRRFELRTY
jgi:hypothetical protein